MSEGKGMREIARNSAAQNNGLHQTKGAEERPRHLVGGRSLRAPFAGEAGCSTLDEATDWPQGNGLQSAGRSQPAMNQQIPSTGGSPQQMVGVAA